MDTQYYDPAKLQALLAQTAPAADGRKVLGDDSWMKLLNALSGVTMKTAAQDGYSSDNNGNSFFTHTDGEYRGADGQFFRQVGVAEDGSPLIQYSNANGHGWDNPTGNAGKDRVQPTYKLGPDGTATPVSAGANYQGSTWVDGGRQLATMAAIMGGGALAGTALAGAGGAAAGAGAAGGGGAFGGGLGLEAGTLGGFGGTGATTGGLLAGETGGFGAAAGYGAGYGGATGLGAAEAGGAFDVSGANGALNEAQGFGTGTEGNYGGAQGAGSYAAAPAAGEGSFGGGLGLNGGYGAGGFGGTGLTSGELLAGGGGAAGLAGAGSNYGSLADYSSAGTSGGSSLTDLAKKYLTNPNGGLNSVGSSLFGLGSSLLAKNGSGTIPMPNYQAAATAQGQSARTDQTNPYGSLKYVQSGVDAQGNPTYRQEVSLNPQGQANMTAAQGAQGTAIGSWNDVLKNAGADWNNISGIWGNAGSQDALVKQAQDAAYSQQARYLDPQYKQQQDALASQLANQGVTMGSQAYTTAMDNFARQRDSAYGNARDSSISQGNALAQQLFGQNLQAHNTGVSDWNTHLGTTGGAAGQAGTIANSFSPTFAAPPAATNYLGAAALQGQGQLNQYNATTGANNSFNNGLFNLGGSVLSNQNWTDLLGKVFTGGNGNASQTAGGG